MLVAKAEWICSRLVDRAASQPLRATVDPLREDDATVAPPAPDAAATTRPSWMSSTRSMTGWAAHAVARTSTVPPPRPSSRRRLDRSPRHARSMNDPDETNVRPARTASAQAPNDSGVRVQAGIGTDRAERHLGRHLVGAADDRQPIAAVQEAVPLADRRPVDAGRQGLHLDRVDLARTRCRRRSPRMGSGKCTATARPPWSRRHPPSRRISQLSGSPMRASGGPRSPSAGPGPRAQQPDVAEHVLAVLAAHDHDVLARRVGDDGGRKVGRLV